MCKNDESEAAVKQAAMDAKMARILEATTSVIRRYGYSRSTMNDYALEAGVSRRALYCLFPGKPALLRAIVRHFTTRRLSLLADRCAQAGDVSAMLDAVTHTLAVEPRAELDATPDAAELLHGVVEAAQIELREAAVATQAALAALFEPHRPAIERAGMTVAQLAAYVQATTKSLYKDARDVEEMAGHLAALKAMLLRVLSSDGP